MEWINLQTEQQLHDIFTGNNPCLIFKHSTRCPISSMAKRNIVMDAPDIPKNVTVYYLDLITYRELSNEIALKWDVTHESPQILLVKGDRCLFHASHEDINIQRAIATL